MKSIPDPKTSPEQKMQAFQDGLQRILNCSKEQLTNALDYEKRMNDSKPKRGPKTSSLGHARRAKKH